MSALAQRRALRVVIRAGLEAKATNAARTGAFALVASDDAPSVRLIGSLTDTFAAGDVDDLLAAIERETACSAELADLESLVA